MTLQVEGIAKEPRENGYSHVAPGSHVRVAGEGRAGTMPCARSLSSHGEAGASFQEGSDVGAPPHHKCLRGHFPSTHPFFMWKGQNAGIGHPVANDVGFIRTLSPYLEEA